MEQQQARLAERTAGNYDERVDNLTNWPPSGAQIDAVHEHASKYCPSSRADSPFSYISKD